MPRSIIVRSVAPAPISMSSACAPKQSMDRVSPGAASCSLIICPLAPDLSPRVSVANQKPSHLISHQMSSFDQESERLQHQFFAVSDTIEHFLRKMKYPPLIQISNLGSNSVVARSLLIK